MCRARFSDATGRPVITASIVFPELEIGYETNLIVDTGADNTCVTELDSILGTFHPTFVSDDIPIYRTTSTGVGGESVNYILETEVLLSFEEYDEDRERFSLHIEHLNQIQISTGSPLNLLGRDVINRFNMDYDPIHGDIVMERDNFGGGRYQVIGADEELSPSLRQFS